MNDPLFKQGREHFSYWVSLPGAIRISLLLLDCSKMRIKKLQNIVVPSTLGGLCVLMLSNGLEYGTRNVAAVLVRSFQPKTCFQDPSPSPLPGTLVKLANGEGTKFTEELDP